MRPYLFAALVLALTAGCTAQPGAGADATPTPTPPDYYGGIQPILNSNCLSCHNSQGIASQYSFESYDQAKGFAPLMKSYTAQRIMPPQPVQNDGSCNTFSNARWLADADIAAIGAWADGGAPEGNPALNQSWTPTTPGLPRVDATVTMPNAYTPDPGLTDDYRCFVVDPGIPSDSYVTGVDVQPGRTSEVHHVILFALDSAGEAAAVAKDTGNGYQCFGGAGVTGSRVVAGWAPGSGPTTLPDTTGIAVSGGRKMLLQIHYNLAGGDLPDQSTVKLMLSATVANPALLFPLAIQSFTLPHGQPDVKISKDFTFNMLPQAVKVRGVLPHMHTLGKTQHTATASQCLVDTPRWDFHWQGAYFYDTPQTLNPGDVVTVTCDYDTTSRTVDVTQGEGTADEMCITFLYVTAN